VMALAQVRNEVDAMRFGAAVAGIKCTRIGGSAGAPTRAEVEAFLARNAPKSAARPGAAARQRVD
jgi:sulfofructose kinase